MPPAETVKVTIFNQTYNLRSVSGAEHVRGIASLVDERMKLMASHLATHDISMIAILAALNIADEMQSLKARYATETEGLPQPSPKVRDEEGRNVPARESEKGSWFDEIFQADAPGKDRAERLSSQISAKLHSLRKNEVAEPAVEITEE